jgi:hypothetical protein
VGKIIALAYLVIGIVVAATNDYFVHLGNIKRILSALLAILLWPLVLLGVDLHIGKLQDGNALIQLLLMGR